MRRSWVGAVAVVVLLCWPATIRADDTPKPSPSGAYRVSCGSCAPAPTYTCDPEYPEKARKKHRGETIAIGLEVGADGLPRDITVVRSVSPELDEAAVNAVKKWKFQPELKDGKAIAAKIQVEMRVD